MSDSYQITLGLGTPSSISRLTLFGLATSFLGLIIGTLYDRPIALSLPDREHLTTTLYDRPISVTLEDR